MSELVSDYIRPQFIEDRLDTEIWAGTFRGINGDKYRKDALVFMALEGSQDVDGLGMQYCAPNILKELRDTYPDMKLMHTEGNCRNGANRLQQAKHRFHEIAGWLYNGTENYCYWNIVLNEDPFK